jgi:hypothetical protein
LTVCIFLWQHKDNIAIKLAQPKWLLLSLLGCALGICVPFLLPVGVIISDEEAYYLGIDGIESTRNRHADQLCFTSIWFVVVGFQVVFFSLIIKTFKLYSLLRTATSSREKLKNERNNLKAVLFVFFLLLTILTGLCGGDGLQYRLKGYSD